MDSVLFDELCEKLTPLIGKKNTVMRDAISAHDRLCVTLRFLASGCSYQDLMYSFRISVSSISKIIPEVCEALYNVLRDEYLQPPSSKQHWEQIAGEFESKWQFPHAVGAIDGKHINMRAPPNSGSEYFNYKKQFSIVLLAIADANAKFISFDLGSPGSQSDGGIFKDSCLGNTCKSNHFPEPANLGERTTPIPYFLLGDDAFALDRNLMKPFPHRTAMGDEKIFNYRLSRARRIVENAFGLLCTRFRLLLRTLELDVPNAMQVVRACIALHNFLMTRKDKCYSAPGSIDNEDEFGNVVPGSWRNQIDSDDICDLRSDPSARSSTLQAREVRDDLKDYFFEEGAISFQWAMTS
ncbi:putative nuclease HARBI1 [Montipora foliosa]